MQTNKTHTNYGEQYQYLRKQVDELVDLIEKDYKAENITGTQKIAFSPERQYKYLELLSKGVLSLREQNDFEASKVAAKGINLTNFYIKKLNALIDKKVNIADYAKYTNIINIYWSFVSVAARYSLHFFIEYMFHNKTKQPYKIRKKLLAPAVFYVGRGLLNQLKLGITFNDNIVPPNKIIFSTFPSSGKTLVANYASAWIKCLSMIKLRGGGFLRIGNEENNVNVNSQSIKDIIADPTILDIFPEMKDMKDNQGKYYPFAKDRLDEWYLKEDLEEPRRASFRTSGSATNGIRINLALIIDDPSRGMVDRNNVDIHNKIISSYNGDWLSRFDNEEDCFVLLIGTRFNNFDVFSSAQKVAEDQGLYQDKKFPNTLKTKDGSTVVINIDCEDDNGKSLYPELISTKTLNEKKSALSKQEYSCVYRQKPIPEEGLDFDYSLLNTYEKPYSIQQLEDYGIASMDPTRKSGADYLSMPIIKKITDAQDQFAGKYAFVNCLFRKKSIKDDNTFNSLIKIIIAYNVRELYLEINTDTSLGKRIQEHCQKQGYNGLKIKEIYNTTKKSQRIADQTQIIIQNIVFPKENLYPRSTDMGSFMDQFTSYSSSRTNKFDDAPDSLATLSKEKLDNVKIKNTIKLNSQSLF